MEQGARILTENENRLKQVTDDCMYLINEIEVKIGIVEMTTYKEKEEKEEWNFQQFGKNEYQTDLFFIRNSGRIQLIINVIKKQNKKVIRERCRIAKLAMGVDMTVSDVEDDD